MYIVRHVPSYKEIRRSLQLASLDKLLPDEEIEDFCRDLGHPWRNRQLPPGVTLRSMVYRGLHPDQSIAATLADLAALAGPKATTPTDSAWCQARSRLPEAVPVEWSFRLALASRRRFGKAYRWHDRWVYRVDGSTVSMPDEPSLVEAFGYTNTRHGKSRFPVARITFIELAGLKSIWDYRINEYTCDEDSQFHEMWDGFPTGCIALLDRKFCSFYNLAKLRQRRIGVVTPLHQKRDPWKLIARGRPVGKDEWIVPFDLDAKLRRQYNDPTLPKRLWVRLIRVCFRRGMRTRTLWLVTTLMDRVKYPRKEVASLYRTRWEIETRIGSLKTTLQMNVLRGKSPGAVQREVAAIILGHNLVWYLIHEAAEKTHTPADRISFAGAVKTTLAFSPALRYADGSVQEQVYAQMLDHIAGHTNHHPFNRVEPRLLKRETARFAYLREPRWKAREKCLS